MVQPVTVSAERRVAPAGYRGYHPSDLHHWHGPALRESLWGHERPVETEWGSPANVGFRRNLAVRPHSSEGQESTQFGLSALPWRRAALARSRRFTSILSASAQPEDGNFTLK
jgi:hypothetical protein